VKRLGLEAKLYGLALESYGLEACDIDTLSLTKDGKWCCLQPSSVVTWLSCSVLVSINEVTLRRARLVLGWVTVFGRVHQT